MENIIFYQDTLNTIKLINVSDLLFLIISLIILFITGSYLTVKHKIMIAFARMYTLITIKTLIIFFILSIKIKDARLLHVDDTFFSSIFVYDFFSIKFLNLLYIFTFFFLLVLYSYVKNKHFITSFEYPLILVCSFIGMYLLLVSHDLFIWFLALELQSFCFYTLAAYRTNRSYLQTEAGLKYFLFGSLASSFYLFGISLIYCLCGTLHLESITILSYFPLQNQYIFNIALIVIFISLSFKLGVAPFHFWLPLVYTYISPIITFLFLLIPKIPLLYLFYLIASFNINNLLYIGIFFSLGFGTFFAFYSTKLKTFFAYSAIANNAFFLAPLINQSYYSFYTYIFYILTYNLLLTLLFLPILFLIRSDFTHALSNLRDLQIMKKSNIVLSLFFCFAIMSLAGIPPFLGFFSKLFILFSALSSSSYLLVFSLLTFSLLVTFYYLRLLKVLFFSADLKFASLTSFPLLPSYIITFFSFINIFYILYPVSLIVLINIF